MGSSSSCVARSLLLSAVCNHPGTWPSSNSSCVARSLLRRATNRRPALAQVGSNSSCVARSLLRAPHRDRMRRRRAPTHPVSLVRCYSPIARPSWWGQRLQLILCRSFVATPAPAHHRSDLARVAPTHPVSLVRCYEVIVPTTAGAEGAPTHPVSLVRCYGTATPACPSEDLRSDLRAATPLTARAPASR